MTMAILGLLAFKAVKHFTGGQPGATPAPAPAPWRAMPRPAAAGSAVSSPVDWAACSPAVPREA